MLEPPRELALPARLPIDEPPDMPPRLPLRDDELGGTLRLPARSPPLMLLVLGRFPPPLSELVLGRFAPPALPGRDVAPPPPNLLAVAELAYGALPRWLGLCCQLLRLPEPILPVLMLPVLMRLKLLLWLM